MAEVTVQFKDGEKTYDTKKEMLKEVGQTILYQANGPMTLRQLYYRFVGYDLLKNKQSQYQYLSKSIKEARLEGTIPWDWLEDRERDTQGGDWSLVDPDDRFEDAFQEFKETAERHHRPRWQGQEHYVEVWIEKKALSGVFARQCRPLNVVTFPSKGYTSITLLKQAAERIRQQTRKKVPPMGNRKSAHVLYFGDFDPSGQDIERNIREKLQDTFNVNVQVHRVALTKQQIHDHNLPPQPAKSTDTRYESFVEDHGNMAVELDALPPQTLRDLITDSVEQYFDEQYYESEIKPEQEKERKHIRRRIDDVLEGGL